MRNSDRLVVPTLLLFTCLLTWKLAGVVGHDPLDEAVYQVFALQNSGAPGWSTLYVAIFRFYFSLGISPAVAFEVHRILVLGIIFPAALVWNARLFLGRWAPAAIMAVLVSPIYGLTGSMPYLHVLNFGALLLLQAAFYSFRKPLHREFVLVALAVLLALRLENAICLLVWVVVYLRSGTTSWRVRWCRAAAALAAGLVLAGALGAFAPGPRAVLAFSDHLKWNPAIRLTANQVPQADDSIIQYCKRHPAICLRHSLSSPGRMLDWSKRVLQWPTPRWASDEHVWFFVCCFALLLILLSLSSLAVAPPRGTMLWALCLGPLLQVTVVSAIFSPWPRYIGGLWALVLVAVTGPVVFALRRSLTPARRWADVSLGVLVFMLGMSFFTNRYARDLGSTVEMDRVARVFRAELVQLPEVFVAPTGWALPHMSLAEAQRARFMFHDPLVPDRSLAQYLDEVGAKLFCAFNTGYDFVIMRNIAIKGQFESDFRRMVATGKGVRRFGDHDTQLTCLPWPQ